MDKIDKKAIEETVRYIMANNIKLPRKKKKKVRAAAFRFVSNMNEEDNWDSIDYCESCLREEPFVLKGWKND